MFPLLLIAALFLVPFVSNRGERAPSRRPVAVLAVIVIYTALGVLTYQGASSPWSPQMTAWSGAPVPEGLVRTSTPLRLEGAVVSKARTAAIATPWKAPAAGAAPI